jgi:predicted nucleic acid-binding protein
MKAAVTKRFVVDASITLAWCFEDEATSFTEAVLDLLSREAEAIAPPIWPFEVANALLMGERRKRLTNTQTGSLLRRIADLPISVDAVRVGYNWRHSVSSSKRTINRV